MNASMISKRHGLVDIFEDIWLFMDHSSSCRDSCHKVYFLIYGRVGYNTCNQEEINQKIWGALRWDCHSKSNCFQMSGPNERIHTLRSELALHRVKITFRIVFVGGDR
ncbi:hypothetical protein NPIL_544601 [Nephila pilipes]|uniref:Uncharacterized protein n=1 Tax=Nephila pilipes TaxID=299642 RepID=A0A8X6PHC6_NEPPI|nr:hypothetical protein NPIL_544601 [Nephila pilipes]